MANHLVEIKKSVSFIFIMNKENKLIPNGTGFFVGVKNETNPETFNVYFVTAKHVLQDSGGNYHSEIFLRLNTKDGESKLIKLKTEDLKISEHGDRDVDIALFSLLPNDATYDFKFIPDSLLANDIVVTQHQIAEGDDVFFSGLFTAHLGQKKNQPIIRFGKVALIPDDKIEWKEHGKEAKFMDLYLLECQSFGGNSGSPVFFQLNPTRVPGQLSLGGPRIFLAGVMTGSFLNGNKVQINQSIPNLVSLQNVGIAAVTPAQKLHEILQSEDLKEQRKKPPVQVESKE